MGAKRVRGNSVTERLPLPPRLPDYEDYDDIIIKTQERATGEGRRASPNTREVAEPASEIRETKRHQSTAPDGRPSASDHTTISVAPVRVKPRQPARLGQKQGGTASDKAVGIRGKAPEQETAQASAKETRVIRDVVHVAGDQTVANTTSAHGKHNIGEIHGEDKLSDGVESDDSAQARSAKKGKGRPQQASSDNEDEEDDEEDDDSEEEDSESSGENVKGKAKSGAGRSTRSTGNSVAKSEKGGSGYYCEGITWMFKQENPRLPEGVWVEKVEDRRIGRWQIAVSSTQITIGDYGEADRDITHRL